MESEESSGKILKIFIPNSLREKALQAAHGASHWGVTSMKRLVKRKMRWPGINAAIVQWVNNCETCSQRKPGGEIKEPLHKAPIPPRPWHTVAVDLVAMPATADGFIYAFTAIDMFSRWAAVVPMKSKKALAVCGKLRSLFQNRWTGPPTVILSDNGGEFVVKSVRRLCARFGVQQRFVSPYNPKANGMIERFNQTLIRMLQGACKEGGEWVKQLQYIVEEYNMIPHSSTGMTPMELFLGRPMRQPRLLPDASDDFGCIEGGR